MKIKIARRTLVSLEAAYTTALALRTIDGGDPLSLLLFECAVELRDRISEMRGKEKKKYTLDLTRSEAAAFHFYWFNQPIHGHDCAQSVNAVLAAIDQVRKSPQRLIPEVL